jgi:hypothetical protein
VCAHNIPAIGSANSKHVVSGLKHEACSRNCQKQVEMRTKTKHSDAHVCLISCGGNTSPMQNSARLQGSSCWIPCLLYMCCPW